VECLLELLPDELGATVGLGINLWMRWSGKEKSGKTFWVRNSTALF
jgi:hypothetical protein